MGLSSSRASSDLIPIHERESNQDYDRYTDVDGEGQVQVEVSREEKLKPMWKYTMMFFLVFVVFVIATGISCSTELSCKEGGPPTVSHIINNTTSTSNYLVAGITSVMYVHSMEVISIYHLICGYAGIAAVVQVIVALLFYGSVFVNLAVNQWYIMAVSSCMLLIWMCIVMEGLRKFYKKGRSNKFWKFTILPVVLYSISAFIYIVFNAIPEISFPGKNVAVLSSEILVLVSASLFAFLVIFHTRWVLIKIVKK